MKFLSGSFHLGHYFVPLHCQMYGIWLLMAFGIFLLKQKWEAFLLVSEFIFPVVIYSEVPFCIKGFLDSGNQVILDDYPVLFLDQSYTKKMDAHKKKECKVVTLNKQEVLTCYLYEVKIGRNKKSLVTYAVIKE